MPIPLEPKHIAGFAKRALVHRSFGRARLIHEHLDRIVSPISRDGERLRLEEFGFSFHPDRERFLLAGMKFVSEIVAGGAGEFANADDGRVEFRSGPVRIVPEGRDDLQVIHEVFFRRLYDGFPPHSPFVLDVGMNIGAAALFFAGIKGWDVIGYEPFPETLSAAENAIARSGLGERIEPRAAALAGKSGTLRVPFHAASRSTNSLYGNLDAARTGEDIEIPISLLDAREAFGDALERAGDRPLLAKVDCEGSEYEILARLAEAGLLTKTATYIVEYHAVPGTEDGPLVGRERLVKLFRTNGFAVQQVWSGIEAGGLFAYRPSAEPVPNKRSPKSPSPGTM